jgi:hypothetical protein
MVALAAILAGCGGSGTPSPKASSPATSHAVTSPAGTNGLENQTAAEVTKAATAALGAAKSVRVQGWMPIDGKKEKFDLQFQGNSNSGTYTVKGVPVKVKKVGNKVYAWLSDSAWEAMGNPPGAMSDYANTWVRFNPGEMTAPVRLGDLAAELTTREYLPEGAARQATLNGQKVVVVTYPDGSELYVANTGPAYPLRLDIPGPAGGRRDFSQYGKDFNITAPKGALDLRTSG